MSDTTPGAAPATGTARAEALWPAAVDGDREAAERLVECTYRRVFAALVKMCGDPDLAADLTQETYRKAWVALPGFRGASAFASWLYRIAYTTYLNHVRRPSRLVALDERTASSLASPELQPPEELHRAERQSRVRRAMLTLPDELAFAVTARYWGEVPVREIARVQEISQVAVRKRLKKALGLLAKAVEVAS